jgi:hypothetical protein
VDQLAADSEGWGFLIHRTQHGLLWSMVPVWPSTEPTLARDLALIPDYLHVMFPPEGTLTRKETSQLEDLVLECEDIFVGPDWSPGFTDMITHKINTGGKFDRVRREGEL